MEKEEIIPNTIYYTTNYETLAEVVKKFAETSNSDILVSDFAKILINNIINKSGIVLVSFNEKKELNGCIVLSMHRDKKGDYVWFDFRWIERSCYKELMRLFYNKVISSCKEKGVKRLQGMGERCFRVINKYYGAYEIGRIFEVNAEEAKLKDENEG